jgi:putative spermidine/putrescine transport system ATP-binding protein
VAELDFARISKRLGTVQALDDVSFRVREGSFYALLGPSGSGKTTALRVIAGFLRPDGGRVIIDGAEITRVPVFRRDMGLVFQSYALFPHLSVRDNVAFGLRMRKWPASRVSEAVDRTLQLVGIEELADRRPAEISGGQQQRVALSRALVIGPKLLLLDEPLSALDRKIRQDLQVVLKRVQREAKVTTIIVTHDQEEALFLADELLVLGSGRVLQAGVPADVYMKPASPFVASFLGAANIWPATIEASGGGLVAVSGDVRVPVDPAAYTPAPGTPADGLVAGADVLVSVRPERVSLSAGPEPAAAGGTGFTAAIREIEFAGPVARVRLESGGITLTSLRLSSDVESLKPGQTSRVVILPASVRCFPIPSPEASS